MGIDCQLGKEPAEALPGHSRKLRTALAASPWFAVPSRW